MDDHGCGDGVTLEHSRAALNGHAPHDAKVPRARGTRQEDIHASVPIPRHAIRKDVPAKATKTHMLTKMDLECLFDISGERDGPHTRHNACGRRRSRRSIGRYRYQEDVLSPITLQDQHTE